MLSNKNWGGKGVGMAIKVAVAERLAGHQSACGKCWAIVFASLVPPHPFPSLIKLSLSWPTSFLTFVLPILFPVQLRGVGDSEQAAVFNTQQNPKKREIYIKENHICHPQIFRFQSKLYGTICYFHGFMLSVCSRTSIPNRYSAEPLAHVCTHMPRERLWHGLQSLQFLPQWALRQRISSASLQCTHLQCSFFTQMIINTLWEA